MTTNKRDLDVVSEFVTKSDGAVTTFPSGSWVAFWHGGPGGFEIARAMFDDAGALVLVSSGDDNQEMTARELVKLLAAARQSR
jgi:hypothetical protein